MRAVEGGCVPAPMQGTRMTHGQCTGHCVWSPALPLPLGLQGDSNPQATRELQISVGKKIHPTCSEKLLYLSLMF